MDNIPIAAARPKQRPRALMKTAACIFLVLKNVIENIENENHTQSSFNYFKKIKQISPSTKL